MQGPLYNKPLRLKNIFAGKELDATDLGHSLSQHLELIIFTRYGEHRHSRQYGCEIWELDFELIVSRQRWEERFRQSLLAAIEKFEPRIYQVEVMVHMTDVEKVFFGRNMPEIKKQVQITVTGTINETGEGYTFNTALFLSPLSS